MLEKAAIALGSNLGDRAAHLRGALDALAATQGVEVEAVSRFLASEPVGPPGQGPYLNAAVVILTSLDPRSLLEHCLAIERRHGRDRGAEQRWGPRTLDLDLLLYGRRIIDEPGLHVPHPRLHRRRFVLEPLAEIAGDWVHPVLGHPIEWLRTSLDTEAEPQHSAGR